MFGLSFQGISLANARNEAVPNRYKKLSVIGRLKELFVQRRNTLPPSKERSIPFDVETKQGSTDTETARNLMQPQLSCNGTGHSKVLSSI